MITAEELLGCVIVEAIMYEGEIDYIMVRSSTGDKFIIEGENYIPCLKVK